MKKTTMLFFGSVLLAISLLNGCSSEGSSTTETIPPYVFDDDFVHNHPYLFTFSGYGTAEGKIDNLADITVDSAGNLYVCDFTLNWRDTIKVQYQNIRK